MTGPNGGGVVRRILPLTSSPKEVETDKKGLPDESHSPPDFKPTQPETNGEDHVAVDATVEATVQSGMDALGSIIHASTLELAGEHKLLFFHPGIFIGIPHSELLELGNWLEVEDLDALSFNLLYRTISG
uniref:Uncharacterized protein n=1 Tax=Ditylenchus dipsaci TaxID=166011 RepID=A0A915CPG2_9BILA